MSSTPGVEPPREFEEYQLLRPLGRGAMGQVFLAKDLLLERLVAVKFIATPEGRRPDATARARFFQEARAIARLQHPNVVAIHRVGEVRGQPFLVSELIRGEPLDRLPLPVEGARLLRLAIGLARGLAAAHRCGVLHRDIKPANAILSEDGEVKLLDFGLAEQWTTEDPRDLSSRTGEVPTPSPVADTRPLPGRAGAEPPARDLNAASPFVVEGAEREAQAPASRTTTPRPTGRASESAAPPTRAETGPDGAGARATSAARTGQNAASWTGALPSTARTGTNAPLHDERTVQVPRVETAPDGAPPRGAGTDLVHASRTNTLGPLFPAPGTPLYLAPELWRGEPASRASDVYALGVLLHELGTGAAPHQHVPLEELGRAVTERPPRSLAEQRLPGLPPGLAAVVDRCLDLDPARRFESGDALREALESLALPTRDTPLPTGNPYRGLHPFEAEHRGVFFGREAALREVVDRLRGERFVLLAGDSGVGKSSLCRAGVLPLLATGESAWSVIACAPGQRPLETLTEALAPVSGESAETLLAQVQDEEPGALSRALRRRPASAPPVLLFIDPLEELVTFSEPHQAARLAEELALVLRRAPRVRLLATARSDCLTRLAALPGLGEELPRALYLLRALTERGLREAIEAPARALGVHFESPALVDSLVTSASRAEGGLPLLQFALQALWDARDTRQGVITSAALEALGGVEGALARHADAVVGRLRPEQRPRARALLLELVTPEGTRMRRTREELLRGPDDDTGRAVLDGLVSGRLLTAGEAEGGGGIYTLAHESLLTGWDTLRGWLGQDEQRRATRHRLERAASEWERLGHPPELLYAERQLGEVRDAALTPEGPRQQAFLARSRQTARRRRGVRWAVAIAAPLVLLAVAGITRVQSRAQLDARITRHLDEARRHGDAALAQDAEARRLRHEALALFDTPGPEKREAAEALWTRVLERERGMEEQSLRAMAELEAAWGLDPGSPRVNEPLADLLAEQVERADRLGPPERRTQLLARLRAYDTTGQRRERLEAPARLDLHTTPPDARVRLVTLTVESPNPADDAGSLLGVTPLSGVDLPPGSHVLLLEAPGHVSVKAPVLLRSGEHLALDLTLPEAGSVPEGFVYVPAGRFLQGAAESEYLRRAFFFAPPLHLVETDAYLIAKHEVTFGEYIAFLESLPDDERVARMPGSRRRLTVVDLSREADGHWRLQLRPASASYSVRDTEPLRYGRRDRRAEQDWLRFPVSAISFEDALAYTTWLDGTGRVPGARVCTEREWERAARGADGRRYPSGDWLAPDDANHDVTYGREPWGFGPDEVGSHPRSRSPFGVDDLAGNVWEWTRSDVNPDKPSAQGGSWYQSDLTAHAANRDRVEPTQREALIGLRVCATPRR
ncbi:SUMF1/EgtB/PvdO family nonheme iron enzyme [Myxococcus sp. K15C18031901]|uniref:nSTAND1 domain-containing NTPase n=1 Tax=Myxococcus dinghuensis TaxID=2906761 RepID=UPI0020A80166|nr:SUMF1/EgtB/PvdO family nonheme iron enzyme [Myxococcus dinghuensis]MCP3103721.1 SUMF1/EgtB/PvdO family nonheme iron enzyme [Myxococcus dinghuensis]